MVSIEFDGYTITNASEDDIPGFLDLHATVFDDWPASNARDIFEWKFGDNPYFDDLPVIVTRKDGEVIGAKGHFGLEMRIGGESILGIQTCDLMVHPDHRRNGIHTKMIEADTTLYDSDEQLFFGFPAREPTKGYLQYGRRRVEHHLYAQSDLQPEAPSLTDRVRSFVDRSRTVFDIEITKTSPIDELVRLYRKQIPDGVHVARSPEFYRWRLADPLNEYTTYMASQAGEVTAAVVISERNNVVLIRDVLPFDPPADAVEELLDAVIDDHSGRKHVLSWCPAQMDRSILTDAGFSLANLMVKLTYSPDIVVREIDDGWSASGVRFDRPENWSMHMIALDH